jgi:hypothetical protein
MRAYIAPGGILPDYELTDHGKTRRRLSELQGNDPMILLLAPGHRCDRHECGRSERIRWSAERRPPTRQGLPPTPSSPCGARRAPR